MMRKRLKIIRRRKAQFVVTIAVVVSVTVLFVLRVIVEPGNRANDGMATQPKETQTHTGVAVKVIEMQSPVTEQETVKYIPDVSGIEESFISDDAYSACIRYGTEYGIAPELLMAMIERESRGDPGAYNGTDSGLMQVAQKWHYGRMERLGVTDLFDTDQNIHVAADFLAELFDRYKDVALVLMVYNMGYEKAYEYYSQGIISEYAQTITVRADELTLLHTYGGVK